MIELLETWFMWARDRHRQIDKLREIPDRTIEVVEAGIDRTC